VVGRTGGARAYTAERAPRAARRRARRTAPVPPPTAADAVREFADRFATLMVQTGLPRTAARVFAAMITTDSGALTSAELVERLRVSPASVSKAVGYLEGLELIGRGRDDHSRRERYLIDDDVWLHTWMTSARTNAMWAEAARQGTGLLGAGTRAGARLAQMTDFFAQLSDDMSGGPAEAAVNDVRTLLAALVQAGQPVTGDRLAAVLGWTGERLAGAIHDAGTHPDLTDPVELAGLGDGTYAAVPRAGRLTAAQRDGLRGSGPRTPRCPGR
jgi:hypothetical protein